MQVAARLQRAGFDTLLVERTPRVGDVSLAAFNPHTGANVPATFLVGRNHGTAQIVAVTDAGASVTGTAAV